MRHNGMGPMMPGNHGGMANSYEFYGEDQPDDSESVEEEVMHVSNKRGGRMAQQTKAGRQASNNGRSGKNEPMGEGQMISGEHIIEPS